MCDGDDDLIDAITVVSAGSDKMQPAKAVIAAPARPVRFGAPRHAHMAKPAMCDAMMPHPRLVVCSLVAGKAKWKSWDS